MLDDVELGGPITRAKAKRMEAIVINLVSRTISVYFSNTKRAHVEQSV